MTGKAFRAALAATVFISAAGVAQAQAAPQAQDAKIADLQRQVDELKAMVRAMQAAQGAAPVAIAQAPATSAPAATTPQPVQMAAVAAPARSQRLRRRRLGTKSCSFAAIPSCG